MLLSGLNIHNVLKLHDFQKPDSFPLSVIHYLLKYDYLRVFRFRFFGGIVVWPDPKEVDGCDCVVILPDPTQAVGCGCVVESDCVPPLGPLS